MKRLVAKFGIAVLTLVGLAAPASPAAALSAGSDSGVNIGFAMSWNPMASPVGASASFLRDDAVSLSNCGSNEIEAPDYRGCSFLYQTELDGQAADTFIDIDNHNFGTVNAYDESAENAICGQDPNLFMLTNFNCFNSNSYGQIFRPTQSAQLTNFQMAISCKASEPISFYAVLYELEPGQNGASPVYSTIKGNPLGSFEITLSNCASSWQNKTFSASDFEIVDMDFGDPQLTAGTTYGVYFAGEFVPGSQIIDVDTLDVSGDVERTADVIRPYDGPVISSFPAGSSRPGGSAVFSGRNLDSISSIEVNGKKCLFELIDGQLFITLPSDLTTGTYDLNITSDYGTLIVQSAVFVAATAEGSSGAGTKRTDNSFRVYYFDPVGKGKVQFFVNGKEIAWVNATTDADPKLRSTLKDGLETSYLVREVELAQGKNVIEVYVDGERVKRVAYSLGGAIIG